MRKTIIIFMLVLAAAAGLDYICQENSKMNREMTEEIIQIEKDLKLGVRPDRETIDRLYRWRNCVDSKYSFEGPTDEFITAYDRVIKPL